MVIEPLGEREQAYFEAIQWKVCPVCLDGGGDGSCKLSGGRTCKIKIYLPNLIDIVMKVNSHRMDEYIDAVLSDICPTCTEQDTEGNCRARQQGDCSLVAYLPLILDAIEETNADLVAS